MAQGKFGHGIDILLFDGRVAAPGRMGAGSAQPDQVGAQAIDAGGETALGDPGQRLVVQGNAARRSRAAWQRSRNCAWAVAHWAQNASGRCRTPGAGE
jgi:hypothetical protein